MDILITSKGAKEMAGVNPIQMEKYLKGRRLSGKQIRPAEACRAKRC